MSCLLVFLSLSLVVSFCAGILINFFFFLWFWQTSLDIVLLLSYFSFLCLHLSLPVSAITLVLITLYFSSRWVPLWLCSVYSVLPRPPPMVMIYECFYSRYVCLTVTYQGEIPPPSSSFPYGLFFFLQTPTVNSNEPHLFFFKEQSKMQLVLHHAHIYLHLCAKYLTNSFMWLIQDTWGFLLCVALFEKILSTLL